VKRLVLVLAALALAGAAAARATPARTGFTPDDPLAAKQWYLTQDRAFDFWPDLLPELPPVRVAVVDSGIDLGHPDLAKQVVAGRSFVGGSWKVDTEGHGTFVAGIIAAATDNAVGIAGMAFPAQLVIAKVVQANGEISTTAEAKAIRWAADNGARVINLSLGGLRDPFHPKLDLYSPAEESAVDYAFRKGAVVVAAVGNGDDTPSEPWPFASYPAALPHVLGVSALSKNGAVPSFSNRDAVYNDVSAPGEGIVSTFPRALTAKFAACADQGYSDCASADYRAGAGTSFAAPQVSAAAALLFAVRPNLRPDQVTALIEHSADDVNASNGCRKCPLLRDALSGWGRLDVASAVGVALNGVLPVADRDETNDEAGAQAWRLNGSARKMSATIDFWDDQVDVYKVYVRRGQRLYVSTTGPAHTDMNLQLWRPGTLRVDGVSAQLSRRVAKSSVPGPAVRLAHTAALSGWYYLEVKISTPGFGPYTLSYAKISAAE
jgi:subtilisin family serine protease